MAKRDVKPKAMISDTAVWCRYDAAVDVEAVIPNPRNPNRHPDKQIALLSKIIRSQGWRQPITVSNRSGFVVKGHGRLAAARLLNVAQVPVEYQDYETEAQEHADLLADNRIAELAEPDNAMLKDLLQELDTGELDMDLTGFDAEDLERLMLQAPPPEAVDLDPPENDAGAIVKCPKCGFSFEV